MKVSYLLAALLALAAADSQAHARLEASEPKAASVLAAPPAVLRLHFNEALEPAFSKLTLRDAASREIAIPMAGAGKPGPNDMSAPLPHLGPGDYRVQWIAVTHDGHRTSGTFAFRVR